jgi:hypothetical protein
MGLMEAICFCPTRVGIDLVKIMGTQLIDNQCTLHWKFAWFAPIGSNKDFRWFSTDAIVGRSGESNFATGAYELIV